jgi:hypothetical protein
VSQSDSTPTDPGPRQQGAITGNVVWQALGNLLLRTTPWLFDFGSWLFGGLIAFNLVIIAALFTIGPTRPAILISTVAFALALPLDVTGLFLLRLAQDAKDLTFDDYLAQEFHDAGFSIEMYLPPPESRKPMRKKMASVVLSYSAGILALSVLLTLIGIIAALWYMAWWIGVAFIVMVILSQALVIIVIVRLMPPESEAEKEYKRQYREQQAEERKKQQKPSKET